jgi:hypothetical protein
MPVLWTLLLANDAYVLLMRKFVIHNYQHRHVSD